MAELNPEVTAILTGPDVQAMLTETADDIARRAAQLATEAVAAQHQLELPEYGTDLTVGTDRARAHVWAVNGAAFHAEAKVAPLMQIIANDGAHR